MHAVHYNYLFICSSVQPKNCTNFSVRFSKNCTNFSDIRLKGKEYHIWRPQMWLAFIISVSQFLNLM